jgi:hypothetical protein
LPTYNYAYVFRLKLPIVTAAPAESVTGSGDLQTYALAVVDGPRGQWLPGITARFPTANDSLGTGKYSLGPAVGYATRSGRFAFGFFAQSFFSVIGPSSRAPVGKSKVAPVLRYALPNGWRLGLSTMTFTYDWVINRWTDVPLGVRVEKHNLGPLNRINVYLEFERNLADISDTPGWTIRTSAQWTFARAPSEPLPDDGDDQ